MKLMKLAMLATALMTTAAYAGSKTETRKVETFSGLAVGGGLKVTVLEGEPSYTVEGKEEQLPWLKHEVKNGVLRIYTDAPGWRTNGPEFKVVVKGPKLKSLSASGGIELQLDAATQPDFKLDASGGVELDAKKLQVNALTVNVSGGAELRLGGAAKKMTIDASGGVDLDSRGLSAETIDIDASGGCDLKVRANQLVNADMSGGVGIKVAGKARAGKIDASGGASIEFESGERG